MRNNKLFGLKIYVNGMDQLITDIKKITDKIHIISGSAVVLKYPIEDKDTYQLFNTDRNIIIPDGITVYFPVKIKCKNCRKILGVELMGKLLDDFQNTGKPVYFLGAKEEVINKMIENFSILYPMLKIAGYHHGYIDKTNCGDIVADIKNSGAYALFVALGAPAQENFIFRYMDELPCSVFMGVGGSFDVFSGMAKRCPKWMSDLHIEWLYRSFSDPSKWGRFFSNIKFMIAAFIKG